MHFVCQELFIHYLYFIENHKITLFADNSVQGKESFLRYQPLLFGKGGYHGKSIRKDGYRRHRMKKAEAIGLKSGSHSGFHSG
jgi:hypothetical protein